MCSYYHLQHINNKVNIVIIHQQQSIGIAQDSQIETPSL